MRVSEHLKINMEWRGILSLFLLLMITTRAHSQADFETREWLTAPGDKPLLFYITGDGGLNSFSSGLCSTLNKQGYDVIALNARKYFWSKKTTQQATADIENFLLRKIS